MQYLLQELKELDAEFNDPVDERKLLLDSKQLENSGFFKIPESWVAVLKQANGIWYNGGEIYGVQPENPSFRDIVTENQDIVWEKTDGVLLLGENDDELLVCDDEGWFCILDKKGEMIWNRTQDPITAVRYILKI